MGMLDGKVAIVTGAGRGIGRSHALTLAREGAAVLVNDLGTSLTGQGADSGPAAQVAAEIIAAGGQAIADTTDIANWDSAKGLIDRATEQFGRLDILVNNAGITEYASIETETGAGWSRVMDVNITGTAALMHWAAQHWVSVGAQPGRAVINTSSPAGTNPPSGAISYVVSKAGVAALTIASAVELAHLGVRVNAIAPMARSRMSDAIPILDEAMKVPEQGLDRMSPDNISRVMLYLASPDCRFSGRVFAVDGDAIYLFESMSAETRIDNGGFAWGHGDLAQALKGVERQDRAYMVAPSVHLRAGSPPNAVFEALDSVAKGETVERLWQPINR